MRIELFITKENENLTSLQNRVNKFINETQADYRIVDIKLALTGMPDSATAMILVMMEDLHKDD